MKVLEQFHNRMAVFTTLNVQHALVTYIGTGLIVQTYSAIVFAVQVVKEAMRN